MKFNSKKPNPVGQSSTFVRNDNTVYFEDSIAAQCRYGDIACAVFQNAEVIWEHSENDYQGFANILVRMPDGTFAHYEWTYGSCSGCDEWENRCLTDQQIEDEMRFAMVTFDDVNVLYRYLHPQSNEDDRRVIPTANTPTNGSIPGMMRYLCGYGSDFNEMTEAFDNWMITHGKTSSGLHPTNYSRCWT